MVAEVSAEERERINAKRAFELDEQRGLFEIALRELLTELPRHVAVTKFDVARMLGVRVGDVHRWCEARQVSDDWPADEKLQPYTELLRTEFRARGGTPWTYE